MMALAMVVIASMIGVKGLGVPVLRAVSNQYLALGMMNGLAIVALAVIFDRVSQAYGKRLQKHRQEATVSDVKVSIKNLYKILGPMTKPWCQKLKMVLQKRHCRLSISMCWA